MLELGEQANSITTLAFLLTKEGSLLIIPVTLPLGSTVQQLGCEGWPGTTGMPGVPGEGAVPEESGTEDCLFELAVARTG